MPDPQTVYSRVVAERRMAAYLAAAHPDAVALVVSGGYWPAFAFVCDVLQHRHWTRFH